MKGEKKPIVSNRLQLTINDMSNNTKSPFPIKSKACRETERCTVNIIDLTRTAKESLFPSDYHYAALFEVTLPANACKEN